MAISPNELPESLKTDDSIDKYIKEITDAVEKAIDDVLSKHPDMVEVIEKDTVDEVARVYSFEVQMPEIKACKPEGVGLKRMMAKAATGDLPVAVVNELIRHYISAQWNSCSAETAQAGRIVKVSLTSNTRKLGAPQA